MQTPLPTGEVHKERRETKGGEDTQTASITARSASAVRQTTNSTMSKTKITIMTTLSHQHATNQQMIIINYLGH